MTEPIRIMMVDDEVDFLETMSFWLRSKGYTVETSSDPIRAVERVKLDPPDVLFLDINMPDLDGLSALRCIRDFNEGLPVVILTAAYQDKEKFATAKELNIAGYFPKQNSLEQFGELVQVTLRAHGKLRKDREA